MENVFGAIAVMHVEIDNGDTREPVHFQRVHGADSDIVENAEPHGAVVSGVVSAGAHGAEGVADLACHYAVNGIHDRARGAARGVERFGVHGGIGVEIGVAALRRHRENLFHVIGVVRTLQHRAGG